MLCSLLFQLCCCCGFFCKWRCVLNDILSLILRGRNKAYGIPTDLRIIFYLVGFAFAMEQQIVVFFCLQRIVVKISPAFLLLIYFLGRKTSIAHVGYLKNIFCFTGNIFCFQFDSLRLQPNFRLLVMPEMNTYYFVQM